MAAFYKFVAFLLLATQAIEGHTFKNFFAGRRSRTGFLPPPPKKASNDPSNVSEFYFSQKLDHFNDSITETWQQVWRTSPRKTEIHLRPFGFYTHVPDILGIHKPKTKPYFTRW